MAKVGAVRDEHGGWPPARQPTAPRRSVEEDLDLLHLEVLDVVNLRWDKIATENTAAPSR